MTGTIQITAKLPIVWKIVLASDCGRAFEFLTSDHLRTRFWARSSQASPGGFDLAFSGGISTHVDIVEAVPPGRLAIRYFGAHVELELAPHGDGAILTATDHGTDPNDWMDRYAGWVNWLLMFKAAVDHGIDLRNNSEWHSWSDGFADQ